MWIPLFALLHLPIPQARATQSPTAAASWLAGDDAMVYDRRSSMI